jgi:hypothetical protein
MGCRRLRVRNRAPGDPAYIIDCYGIHTNGVAMDSRSFFVGGKMPQSLVGWGLQPIICLEKQQDLLRARSCGMIIAEAGDFLRIDGRWWAKRPTIWRAILDRYFRPFHGDRCQLYYHLPRSSPGFIALDYLVSGSGTSLKTVTMALQVLDRIAEIRKSDAIVAHLSNSRVTSRLLKRLGWERHLGGTTSPHVIRRFYGRYPSHGAPVRDELGLASPMMTLR